MTASPMAYDLAGACERNGPDPLKPVADTLDLDHELDALSRMDRKALRDRWHKEFRRRAPTSISTQKLARTLGYRLQVAHFGIDDGLLATMGLTRFSSLTDGAGIPLVLRRSWRGRDHEVIKEGNNYLHEGKSYRSLSAVARAITGTRWNGWTFFGLKSPNSKAAPDGD